MRWADKSKKVYFFSSHWIENHLYTMDIVEQAFNEGYINKKQLYNADNKIREANNARCNRDGFFNYYKDSIQPLKILQQLVAVYFKLSPDDIKCSNSNPKHIKPCQLAVYLCKKLTYCSLAEIKEFFGANDENWVVLASEIIEKECKTKKALFCAIKRISRIAYEYRVSKRN